MSVGNIKGFFQDIVKDLLIVGGVSYLGGTTLSFKDTNLDYLPIDIKKYPYVDNGKEKSDLFSLELFTQFGFPYTMINDKQNDFVNDVKVWLALTCATFFIYIRKIFRSLIKHLKHYYPSLFGNLFFFYVFPLIFIYLLRQHSFLLGLFCFLAFLCAIWLENYIICFSFFTFPWWVYRGTETTFMKIILAIIFFWVGVFFVPVYFIWWYLLANVGLLYTSIFYLFSPTFNGIHNVIQEAGKHKLTLTILFMILALRSANTFLTSPLVKSGMMASCISFLIYWFYSSYYSKK
jgi:hypothetical protein